MISRFDPSWWQRRETIDSNRKQNRFTGSSLTKNQRKSLSLIAPHHVAILMAEDHRSSTIEWGCHHIGGGRTHGRRYAKHCPAPVWRHTMASDDRRREYLNPIASVLLHSI